MSRSIFREGGPLGIRRTGNEQFEMSVPLPKDADGRIARECTDESCSPGYFKVKLGTGITGVQTTVYCPYCRAGDKPENFATRAQVEYARSLALREAHQGFDRMIRDTLKLGSSGRRNLASGLISINMEYKPATLPPVRHPFEDEVRRDVVCPHCGLDHTVFGLATWCADCGADIFMTHVQGELTVVRAMAGDVARRTELLGKRVAAKDLENCLEDVVSIFEAAMKAIFRQGLSARGDNQEESEGILKRIGNGFQNIDRTRKQITETFGLELEASVPWESLRGPFEKRHPITHNLGVVDRKYLEKVNQAGREGREIRIRPDEINTLLTDVGAALARIREAILAANDQAASTSCS